MTEDPNKTDTPQEDASAETPAAEAPAPEASEDKTPVEETTPEVVEPAVETTSKETTPEVVEPAVKPTAKETTSKTVEPAAEPKTKKSPKSEPEDGHWWWGTGRRKAAVARVRIRPGNGEFKVNKRDLTQYFTETRDQKDILTLLEKSSTKDSLDVVVRTNGGGYTGQAGAIILGLGRALSKYDPTLESMLRSNGYLSRDPRRVERKKPGQPGARRRFQFSKR